MNDLDFCLEVVSRSRQPLCYIRCWTARKLLVIDLVSNDYQLKMTYEESNGQTKLVTPVQYAYSTISWHSWRCYL